MTEEKISCSRFTNSLKVLQAANFFAEGRYTEALTLYQQLEHLLGPDAFSANIWLCERRLHSAVVLAAANLTDFPAASRAFYQQGQIRAVQLALEAMQARGHVFTSKQQEIKDVADGFARLQRQGCAVPPRLPMPCTPIRARHLLYCLHQSVPYTSNGYATRSHGVAVGLQQAGWMVSVATRPGFPWDTAGGTGMVEHDHQTTVVDGIAYHAAMPAMRLGTIPEDRYIEMAAHHFMSVAQMVGAEIILAASNHITALPALIAARRLGLPLVYEVRGLWEVTQASIQPQWAGSERYHLMRALEKQAACEADLLITLTSELADELVSWGVSRDRIRLVPNAVDSARFHPMEPDATIIQQLALPSGVPVIGYAGSAVAYEGLELLMDALAMLKQHGQNFTFVLVGDGNVIDTVKARAQALGLQEYCRFTGRVPFDQVPQYLSCMDIMPVPRLSLPVTEMVSALKPLEAMAMGKAVVLSDVSPHQIMAGHNQRACLFRKDSAQDLCRVLQQLVDNPQQRSQIGQAARDWIEKERTWAGVTRLYADALQQIVRY